MKSVSALQASLSSWHWSESRLSHPLVKKGQERKAVILRASSSEFLALSVEMSSNRHGKT